jgi:hypothetical protein
MPDSNGYCNNLYAARFMEGVSNYCTQAVDLTSSLDCSTVLNPKYWVNSIKVSPSTAYTN